MILDFDFMIQEVEKAITESGKQEGVAFALLTDKGNLLVAFCHAFCQGFGEKLCDEPVTLNQMISSQDTRVLKIVTAYKARGQKGIEEPCAWLRQFIYDMNRKNAEAEVCMQGKDKLIVKTLKEFRVLKNNLCGL
jgi:cytidine deaminase